MSTKTMTLRRRGMEVPRRLSRLAEAVKTEAKRRQLPVRARAGYKKTLRILAAGALAGLTLLEIVAKDAKSRKQQEAAPRRQASHADISRRAYEIYLARGAAAGHEMDDWLKAESELLGRGNRLAQR